MKIIKQIFRFFGLCIIITAVFSCVLDNELAENRENKNHNYIYYPYYEIFYDIPAAEWIYKEDGSLVFSSSPPEKYSNVNFKKVYKVHFQYKGTNPYNFLPTFKGKNQNAAESDTFEIAAPPLSR